MVVYRHVGRDVRAAGGVSTIDTAQPVGGVTLRLRLRLRLRLNKGLMAYAANFLIASASYSA